MSRSRSRTADYDLRRDARYLDAFIKGGGHVASPSDTPWPTPMPPGFWRWALRVLEEQRAREYRVPIYVTALPGSHCQIAEGHPAANKPQAVWTIPFLRLSLAGELPGEARFQ